ncbi:uncharacterized protein NEMAJ01_0849 [Nematocida major]|uniref:uncharacterized protein n=1 Tax=Nematocida major TaxID=1912982 RepID=UPI0020082EF5|nr:uncharacterized protein NEMAJ01_0849 [Nematocida major]KAH9385953.1 hypothetical protein NEMAJ01_0849 [Nematocida major]
MKGGPGEHIPSRLLEIIDRGAGDFAQDTAQKKHLTYMGEAARSHTMTHTMIQKLRLGVVDTLVPGSGEWSLVYSSEMHGYSLNTLMRNAKNGPQKGCFILSVLEDFGTQEEYERVFGAVFFEPLRFEKASYGTIDTALFRFKTPRAQDMSKGSNAILNIYSAKSIENRRMYIIAKKEYLAFGCGNGRFGLQFEKSLQQGESHGVETFNNDTLSHRERFKISRIELWHVEA